LLPKESLVIHEAYRFNRNSGASTSWRERSRGRIADEGNVLACRPIRPLGSYFPTGRSGRSLLAPGLQPLWATLGVTLQDAD
jgi:hypothetical protein